MSEGERLPERPTPEDVLRVQAETRERRRERNARFAAMDMSAKPPEPDRKVESFALTGFFDKIEMEDIRVGKNLLFRVPSVADMEKLFQFIRRSDIESLLTTDYNSDSNYRNSFRNVSRWVGRGTEKLREADYFFTEGQEGEAKLRVDEARHSLVMAQQTSEALGRRYFPEHYSDGTQPSDGSQERS